MKGKRSFEVVTAEGGKQALRSRRLATWEKSALAQCFTCGGIEFRAATAGGAGNDGEYRGTAALSRHAQVRLEREAVVLAMGPMLEGQ